MTVLRAFFCSVLIAALLLLPVNSVGQAAADLDKAIPATTE